MNSGIKDIDILKLIPQRRPFVLVDSLVHCDSVRTVTHFLVPENHIFSAGGEFQEYGLVENIAQTCAARMGYISKESVKLGFIGAIRNLEIYRKALVGELLTTSIEVVEEVFNMTLVKASVKVGEEEIASAMMKIAISDIDAC